MKPWGANNTDIATHWRTEAANMSMASLWFHSILTLIPWVFYIIFKAMIDNTEIWHEEMDRRWAAERERKDK